MSSDMAKAVCLNLCPEFSFELISQGGMALSPRVLPSALPTRNPVGYRIPRQRRASNAFFLNESVALPFATTPTPVW